MSYNSTPSRRCPDSVTGEPNLFARRSARTPLVFELIRTHLESSPEAHCRGIAHSQVCYCAAGRFCSAFGRWCELWLHCRPHHAPSARRGAVISGAASIFVAPCEQNGRLALPRTGGKARERSRREIAARWPLSGARRRHPPPRSASFEPAPGPARPARSSGPSRAWTHSNRSRHPAAAALSFA